MQVLPLQTFINTTFKAFYFSLVEVCTPESAGRSSVHEGLWFHYSTPNFQAEFAQIGLLHIAPSQKTCTHQTYIRNNFTTTSFTSIQCLRSKVSTLNRRFEHLLQPQSGCFSPHLTILSGTSTSFFNHSSEAKQQLLHCAFSRHLCQTEYSSPSVLECCCPCF